MMQQDRRNQYSIAPIPIRLAKQLVECLHTYLKPAPSGLFALACLHSTDTIGVAIVGRPISPHQQDGLTCEISRLAMLAGHYNAATFFISRIEIAARSLGYHRIITYVHDDHIGGCFTASGWTNSASSRPTNWHGREDSNAHDHGKILRFEKMIRNPHSISLHLTSSLHSTHQLNGQPSLEQPSLHE